jgi:glycosyltransferase involved in cell wall biosynthesis
MKRTRPLVSIGLPVYNGEQYLKKAVMAILRQTLRDFELIISDNGSNDDTEYICRKLQIKDRRIKYLRNKINRGPIWNFNRVFKLAVGDYFMWASHDDYWQPQYLQSCLEGFDASKDIVLVGTQAKVINWGPKEIISTEKEFSTVGLDPWERFIKFRALIHQIKYLGIIFYGLYKRNILKQAMPLANYIGADHLLLAKMSFLGEFLTIKKQLMLKRFGGGSKNFKHNALIMGIKNDFLINHPLLVREFFLQKIVFLTTKINFISKLILSFYSFINYFLLVVNKKRFI